MFIIYSCIVVNKLYFNWCSRTLEKLAAERNVEFVSVVPFFFFFLKRKIDDTSEMIGPIIKV